MSSRGYGSHLKSKEISIALGHMKIIPVELGVLCIVTSVFWCSVAGKNTRARLHIPTNEEVVVQWPQLQHKEPRGPQETKGRCRTMSRTTCQIKQSVNSTKAETLVADTRVRNMKSARKTQGCIQVSESSTGKDAAQEKKNLGNPTPTARVNSSKACAKQSLGDLQFDGNFEGANIAFVKHAEDGSEVEIWLEHDNLNPR